MFIDYASLDYNSIIADTYFIENKKYCVIFEINLTDHKVGGTADYQNFKTTVKLADGIIPNNLGRLTYDLYLDSLNLEKQESENLEEPVYPDKLNSEFSAWEEKIFRKIIKNFTFFYY